MSLQPGDRVGPYEIVALLGEGGMGTVYRAHDARLGRDVAIKAVRTPFATDPDRIARFEREARLLASLNHPHVATIHGLERLDDGKMLLVMELVEGPTLAEELRGGPLPLRDTLRAALEIAAAIEAAHDRNIIHRDLKPGNIKLTRSGVKVLDFGLAKALDVNPGATALAQSPTLTAGGTGAGVILGTAAYMSPEQARGKEVDKRSDVWAFGCVLFDMVTGRPAFAGDTLSDTLAAILTRDPDWSLVPAGVPAPVCRLLRHCFEKDVNRRLRDIGDARFELEEAVAVASSSASGEAAALTTTAGAWRKPAARSRTPLVGVVALVTGVLLGGTAVWMWPIRGGASRAQPIVRMALPIGGEQQLAALDFQVVAISPTETHIAYLASRRGRQQLFVRPLSQLEAAPLEGTAGAINPFFSPDGKWIGFFAGGKLRKVPVGGGPVRDIADAEIGLGAAWGPDGTIVFAPNNASGLARVSAEGGNVQPVTTLDSARGEFSHRWPDLLPDGKTVVFAIGTVGSWDDADIAVQRIDGGNRRIIVEGGTYPRVLRTGQLLYARGGAIHSVAFDPRSFTVGGTSTRVLDRVLQSADGAAQIAVSATGSIVYVPGAGGENARTLVWVDRQGIAQPLAAPPRAYTLPRLSPDGQTVAVGVGGTPEQIWIYSIPAGQFAQLTFDGGNAPAWSSDGTRVFFSAARGAAAAVFVKPVDGTTEQRLTRGERAAATQSVSSSGAVLFTEFDPTNGRDISLLLPDGTTRSLVATPANESAPAFSPDGSGFAFVSDESGRAEVYVAALADPNRHVRISTAGGTEPVWRRDGSELFFRSGTKMMSATMRTRPALPAGVPRQLFDAPFESGTAASPAYDVSSDGMRFLMVRPAATGRDGRELRVVLGWAGELKR